MQKQKARTKETMNPLQARERSTRRKPGEHAVQKPPDEKLAHRIPRKHSPPLAHPMVG